MAREAIADGYDTCPITSVLAADVEGSVLDQVQRLLAVPELVARTWKTLRREGRDDATEGEVTNLLGDFASLWNELFPAEQVRIVQLLVERVDVPRRRLDEPRQRTAPERKEGSVSDGVETRLEGTALVLRIPMSFRRHGGRKRIVAPDGREIVQTSKPPPDGTLVKALARAWRWQRMLDKGVYATVSEIGDAENISRSYVSRILRLALLAPDIVERILDGRPTAGLAQLLRPSPVDWERQRQTPL